MQANHLKNNVQALSFRVETSIHQRKIQVQPQMYTIQRPACYLLVCSLLLIATCTSSNLQLLKISKILLIQCFAEDGPIGQVAVGQITAQMAEEHISLIGTRTYLIDWSQNR